MSIQHITLDTDKLARQIDEIAQQSLDSDAAERLSDIAHMLLTTLIDYHKSHGEAWKLIGRCDMAFEQIAAARLLDHRKRIAKQMRDEIKKASQS